MSAAMAGDRADRIRARIEEHFANARIELIDDSHRHVGHAGAREGKGHFRLHIVSDRFMGLRPLQRHQLIYQVLAEMMQTEIHALNIVALTSQEAADTRS